MQAMKKNKLYNQFWGNIVKQIDQRYRPDCECAESIYLSRINSD